MYTTQSGVGMNFSGNFSLTPVSFELLLIMFVVAQFDYTVEEPSNDPADPLPEIKVTDQIIGYLGSDWHGPFMCFDGLPVHVQSQDEKTYKVAQRDTFLTVQAAEEALSEYLRTLGHSYHRHLHLHPQYKVLPV